MKLHSDAALRATLDSFPLSPADREGLERYSYGLSLSGAFEATIRGFHDHPFNVLLGMLWVLPYSAVIAACAVALDVRPRRYAIGVAVLTTLAPCLILLIAWDLSRFLVWSTFAAELALLAAVPAQAKDRVTSTRATEAQATDALDDAAATRATERARPLSPRVAYACGAWLVTASILSTGPHVYLYFDSAFALWPFGPAVLDKTPGGVLGLAFTDLYNRGRPTTYHLTEYRCEPDFDRTHVTPHPEACQFDVDAHGSLETPVLYLPSGHYVAKLDDDTRSSLRERARAHVRNVVLALRRDARGGHHHDARSDDAPVRFVGRGRGDWRGASAGGGR